MFNIHLGIHSKAEQLTNASIQVQCHTNDKQNNLSSILMFHIRLVCEFSTQSITKVVCRKQDRLRIVHVARETLRRCTCRWRLSCNLIFQYNLTKAQIKEPQRTYEKCLVDNYINHKVKGK